MNLALHGLLLQVILSILNFKHGFRLCSAGEPGYLDFDNLPETNFSCQGKVIGGYYADVEAGCQMFHVCTIGQKDEIMDIKFLCLNGTVFDQETRVCERVDEVDCSKSERFYNLNLELYGNNAVTLSLHEEEDEEESTELREENHHQQQHITSARPSTTSTTTTTTSRPSQPSTTSANNIYQQHPTGYPQHYQPRPAFPSVQTSQSNTHYDDKNGGYHHQYIFHNDERNNNNQATSYQLFSNQGVSSTTPTPQVHQQIRYSSTVSPQVIHNEPSTGAPIQFHVQSTSSSIQTLLNSNANNPSLINPLYHNHGIASTTEQFNRNNPREIVEYQDNSEDDENEQNERRPLEAIQSTNKGKVSKLTISPVPQQDNRPMIIQTKSSQSLQQPRISVNYLPTPAPIQTTINAFYPTQRSNSQNAQKSLNNQHVTQHIHVPPPQPIPQLKPHHVTITIPPSDIQRIVQNPSPLLPSQSRVIVTAKASVSDESGRPLNTSQLITLPLPKIPSNYDDYKEGDESFDPFYRDVPKIRNDHRIVVNRKIETNERNMRRKRSVNNEEIHGSSPSEQVIFNAEIKDIMDLKANLPIIKAILFDLPLPENIKTASDRSTKNNENESVNNTNMKNETIADNLQNIKPWLAFVPNQNTTLKSNQYSMKKIDEQEFSNVQLPTTMKSEEKQYILSNINIKPVNTEDRFDQLLSTNLQQKEGFDALNAKHDHIKTGPKDSIHLFLSSIRDNTSINERTITVQNDLLIPLNNIQNKTDKVKQEILQTRPSSNRNKSNRRKFQNHGPIEESEEYSSSRDSRINNPKLSRYYAEYDASESIESSSRQRPNRLRQRLRGGRIVNYRDEYIDDENIEDDRYGEDNVSTARKRTLRRGSQGRRVHYRNSNRDYDYKDDAEVDEKPKARTKNINISDRFKPQTHSENLSNYTEQKVELTERRGNNRGPLSDPLHNGRSSNKTYTIDGRINEKIDTKLSEDINPHEIAEKRKKLLKYSLISEHDRATERKWLNSAVKGKESNEPNEQSQEDYLESSELYADDYNESMEDVPDDYVDYRDLREPVRRSRLNNFKNNNKFIEEFELIPERKTHRRNKSRKFVNDVPLNQDNVEEADEDGNIESTTYKDDKDTKMTNIPEDYTTSDEANTSVESHDYKSSNSSQVEVTELPKTTVGITSTEGVIKFTDELPRTDKKDEVQDYIINKDKVVTNEQEYVDDNYEPESYIDFKYKESLSGLSLTKENLKEKIFIVSGEQKDIHIANNKSSSNDSSAHIEKHQEYDDIYEDRLKSITALYSSDEYEDLETTTDIISRSATLPPVITAAPVSSPSSRIKTITKTSTTTIPTTIITTTTTTSTTITTTTSTPSTTYSTASASTTPSQSRTKATSKFFKPITFRKNYAYIPPSTTPAAVLIRRGKPLSGPKPTKPPPSYNELAPKPIIRRLPLLSRTTTTTSEATLIEDKIDSDLSKYDSEETSTSPNDNLTASTIMKQHSPLNEITTTLVTTIKMKSNKDITEVLDSTTVNMNDHTQPQEAYTSTPLQYNQTIHSTNKNHDNEVSKQILDSKESNNVPQTSKDSVAETAKPNLATSVNDGLSTLQISTKWETSNPKILDIQTITTTTTTIKTPRPSERRKIESISGKSEIQKSIQSPKRVAGFNCLEKEMYRFYGDSRDCRLFHYCSPGFTVRQVLDFRFVCEEGTIFDEESQSCRHDVPTPKCVKRTW